MNRANDLLAWLIVGALIVALLLFLVAAFSIYVGWLNNWLLP